MEELPAARPAFFGGVSDPVCTSTVSSPSLAMTAEAFAAIAVAGIAPAAVGDIRSIVHTAWGFEIGS